MSERIVTEKFRIVCRGTEGPEEGRYSVYGHQLPDGRFLTLNTAPGQGDDVWGSRDEYSPNGTDEIESITSLGVSSVDASAVNGAEAEECGYCATDVPASAAVPAADDDAAWTALAALHRPDCEWILTRAHRPGRLVDYDTTDVIRPATPAEQAASRAAAERDGGRGVIDVDGRRCYVED